MSMYNILNYTGAAALVLYNLLHMKERRNFFGGRLRIYAAKYREAGKRSFLCSDTFCLVLEIIAISVFQYAPALFMNKAFGDLVDTGANYFGLLYLAPMFMYAGAWIIGTEPFKQIDIITPAYPLALFFSKLGCFATGCCRGFVWKYGFYNSASGYREFPSQLLEAVVALLIFLFLALKRKKMKDGTVFPIYLMLFSGLRFLTEFTRIEEAVFLGLKTYHYLCLVGLVIGTLEYYLAISDKRNIE